MSSPPIQTPTYVYETDNHDQCRLRIPLADATNKKEEREVQLTVKVGVMKVVGARGRVVAGLRDPSGFYFVLNEWIEDCTVVHGAPSQNGNPTLEFRSGLHRAETLFSAEHDGTESSWQIFARKEPSEPLAIVSNGDKVKILKVAQDERSAMLLGCTILTLLLYHENGPSLKHPTREGLIMPVTGHGE
ncbi:hypothetical protein C8R47DRAFT_1080563 [Mycena vitilis]|nr:hypothetical protein C8R47DRAFT_1080563 [Mycena vitilis]